MSQSDNPFRKILIPLVMMQLVLLSTAISISVACVGNIIVIGTSESPRNRLAAELVMQLIAERTGSATKIINYGDILEIEKDIVAKNDSRRIDLLLTNNLTSQWGISFLRNTEDEGDNLKFILRMEGKKFGYWQLSDQTWFSANLGFYPLLREDILNDVPLLPRLLRKLSTNIDVGEFKSFVESVESGEKAKNVAKKILEQKGLI